MNEFGSKQSKGWLVSLSLQSVVPLEDNVLIGSVVIGDLLVVNPVVQSTQHPALVNLLTYCFVSQIFKNLNALQTFPFRLNLFNGTLY